MSCLFWFCFPPRLAADLWESCCLLLWMVKFFRFFSFPGQFVVSGFLHWWQKFSFDWGLLLFFSDSYSWICEHPCMGIFSNHALDGRIIAPVGASWIACFSFCLRPHTCLRWVSSLLCFLLLGLQNLLFIWIGCLDDVFLQMLFNFDAFLQIGEFCPGVGAMRSLLNFIKFW